MSRSQCGNLLLCGVALALLGPRSLVAQERERSALANKESERTVRFGATATPGGQPPIAATHPLAHVLKFAREEQAFLKRNVRDSTCRLVKRERIDGTLQDYCHIDMRVQEEIVQGDAITSPLKVSLSFLAPATVAGRRVLYVGGENEGKMLVRKGGQRFSYVIVKIDPWGEAAQRESLLPITELGFGRILDRMIDILTAHAATDPAGENTQVTFSKGAKVNGRVCDAIRIVHAEHRNGLQFHIANVYIDTELHVPVRIDVCDWPEKPAAAAPLLAEYTYTNLQLNVSLPPSTFDRDVLTKK